MDTILPLSLRHALLAFNRSQGIFGITKSRQMYRIHHIRVVFKHCLPLLFVEGWTLVSGVVDMLHIDHIARYLDIAEYLDSGGLNRAVDACA